MRKALFSFILLCLQLIAYAQPEQFEAFGVCTDDEGPVSGIRVTVKAGGTQIKTDDTDGKGEFFVKLDYGKDYVLEFSKPGYATKKISVKSSGVTKDQVSVGQKYDSWQVSMLHFVQGVDYSALDKPVGEIYFNQKTGYFDWDADYTLGVYQQIEEMMDEVEKKKKEADKAFNSALKEAEKAASKGDYAGARNFLNEAKKIRPHDEQVGQLVSNLDKVEEEAKAKAEAEAQAEAQKKEEERLAEAAAAKAKAEEEAQKQAEKQAEEQAKEQAKADADAKAKAAKEAEAKKEAEKQKELAETKSEKPEPKEEKPNTFTPSKKEPPKFKAVTGSTGSPPNKPEVTGTTGKPVQEKPEFSAPEQKIPEKKEVTGSTGKPVQAKPEFKAPEPKVVEKPKVTPPPAPKPTPKPTPQPKKVTPKPSGPKTFDLSSANLQDPTFYLELQDRYPVGVTEEVKEVGRRTITYRVLIDNEHHGYLYRMVKQPWGAENFFKNNTPISRFQYEKETDQTRFKL